jgi:dTDP-4-amino-4,6-dideoxygalactose transaminase
MIPFLDLQVQYRTTQSEIEKAIQSVLSSSQYILGKHVADFEAAFAAYCDCKHAVGVNSGTSALHLALLAAGIGPGDEVITVPFTFVATVAAICYTGARPVFADIDPATFTINPQRLASALTPRTKAVLPVHLYGQPADMDPILAFARKHNLVVIEDAAQAHGARYKGRRVGSIGDLGCFSFYPGKNLGAYGEGGAVTTGNDAYARTIRMLRDWGQEKKYHHVLRGYNYRLEGMQGAVLNVKLPRLDEANRRRAENAANYQAQLAGLPVVAPKIAAYATHVFHVYAIRTSKREELQKELTAAGVQTGIHYPFPVHLTEAYGDLGYKPGDFPESERAAREVLSLPMFPELTEEQIRSVASAVGNAACLREFSGVSA